MAFSIIGMGMKNTFQVYIKYLVTLKINYIFLYRFISFYIFEIYFYNVICLYILLLKIKLWPAFLVFLYLRLFGVFT